MSGKKSALKHYWRAIRRISQPGQKPSRKMKYPLALSKGLRYIRPTLSTACRAPIV